MAALAKSIALMIAAGCVALGGLAATPLEAQSSSSNPTRDAVLDVIFTTVERRIIEDYFGVSRSDYGARKGKHKQKHKAKGKGKGGKKGLPPGLAKRKSLPPGLAKRKTLPPGLAKRDLPHDLDQYLGPPPHGTERSVVDGNILLVEIATGIVLDIVEDVILKQ